MDIDMVFTYVDGHDPDFVKTKNFYLQKEGKKIQNLNPKIRTENVEEIIYSVKSVLKFIPWIRKIFIVTANQIPPIEDYGGRVIIINHKQIIDEKYLPTYNSDVIESCIHKIPGLSDIFLYNNDDVLHFNYVKRNDIYEVKDNKILLRIRNNLPYYFCVDDNCKFQKGKRRITVSSGFRKLFITFIKNFEGEYMVRILKTSLLFLQKNHNCILSNNHHTKVLRKSTCQFVENKYPNLLHELRQRRFRSNDYIQYVFFVTNVDNILNKNLITENDKDVLEIFYEGKKYNKGIFDEIIEKKPKFLCMNGMDLSFKHGLKEFMDKNL